MVAPGTGGSEARPQTRARSAPTWLCVPRRAQTCQAVRQVCGARGGPSVAIRRARPGRACDTVGNVDQPRVPRDGEAVGRARLQDVGSVNWRGLNRRGRRATADHALLVGAERRADLHEMHGLQVRHHVRKPSQCLRSGARPSAGSEWRANGDAPHPRGAAGIASLVSAAGVPRCQRRPGHTHPQHVTHERRAAGPKLHQLKGAAARSAAQRRDGPHREELPARHPRGADAACFAHQQRHSQARARA